MKKRKSQKWLKFRHKVVRNVLYGTLGVYTRLRYNVKIEKFKEQNGRQYLILFRQMRNIRKLFSIFLLILPNSQVSTLPYLQ